ncbi:hypothetical protein NUW58_g6768 [Xylaria curta]|uniref:Uncharacterized protein n=1 Tax=Xylaria curta TaxID=42375 RepID=A0ACC1NQI9_9PEZI|nr:hypothetical protein NUW58_g6768 [Xylaria curta]
MAAFPMFAWTREPHDARLVTSSAALAACASCESASTGCQSLPGSLTLGSTFVIVYTTHNAPEAQARLQLDVDGLAERYATVLDAIHRKAPNAYVLVIEYQAVLGPDTRPYDDVVFGADRIAHHREVAARLLEATRNAVQGREEWCGTVGIAEASEAHAVGAEDPWISGFTWKLFYRGGAYHPRPEGMVAIANLIYAKLVQLGLVSQDQATRDEDTEEGFVML